MNVAKWRAARNKMLRQVCLTFVTALLTLVKVTEFGDPIVPAFVVLATLVFIWIEEDYLDRAQESFVLTLVVGVQALFYFDHLGAGLTIFVASVSLAIIWHGVVRDWWGRRAQPAVLREVHASKRDFVHPIQSTARRTQALIHTPVKRPRRRSP